MEIPKIDHFFEEKNIFRKIKLQKFIFIVKFGFYGHIDGRVGCSASHSFSSILWRFLVFASVSLYIRVPIYIEKSPTCKNGILPTKITYFAKDVLQHKK